ncbi:MAG: hypothetical protein FJ387_01400 [Verrucomicrobia bacterium]|nr:hypothetical protein [Verrucomicrobiota bacterium]
MGQAAAFPDPLDRANAAVAGPGADPRGQGIPNLVRYALGLALTDHPGTRVPQYAVTPSRPAIRFPFDAGRNDLVYQVETTASVTDWGAGVVLFDSRTDLPPATDQGWVTIVEPAPGRAVLPHRCPD